MMSATKIAKIILTKDTCYGSFEDRRISDDELAEYFAMFIDEYAKEYHKTQTVIDAENLRLEEEEKIHWWNTSDTE
jgi:hypothetical protein